MSGKYLFDTNSIVYYLQGRPDWVDLIDNTPMEERAASIITRMELLSYPGIESTEEDRIRHFLADLVVISIDDPIEEKAITIRRKNQIKLPDAIIAATAVVMDAVLMTGDQRLIDLEWPGLRTSNPA